MKTNPALYAEGLRQMLRGGETDESVAAGIRLASLLLLVESHFTRHGK
jgi:hypothetical protein